jgi:hypothetical protein
MAALPLASDFASLSSGREGDRRRNMRQAFLVDDNPADVVPAREALAWSGAQIRLSSKRGRRRSYGWQSMQEYWLGLKSLPR